HAFMTNRMKSDLRACGFSEEQLLELTPQEGDEILAAATSYDEAERKAEAQLFLDALAPGGRFMFQTFDDNAERKDGGLVRQLYGTLDEHWHELNELNNRGAGIFVTVNETDGKGRETANIVSIRANFIDQDGPPQPENPHLPVTITTETSPDH